MILKVRLHNEHQFDNVDTMFIIYLNKDDYQDEAP